MAGLLPKRRAQHEIARADDQLLRKHEAYLEAWLKADERSSERKKEGAPKRVGDKPRKSRR